MLEVTEKWEKEVPPEVKDNLYQSSLSLDIQTVLNEHGHSTGCMAVPPGAAIMDVSHALTEYIRAENAIYYNF